jgi:hypothetical protein
MAIFPVLELESKIQTDEKTRLSGIKSYKTPNEIAVSLVRIQPDTLEDFYEISASDPTDSAKWFLDWQYATAGAKAVSLEITTDPLATAVIITKTIEVVDPLDEKLFSTDYDLMSEEPDMLRFIKDGKSGYNDLHRTAQYKIMDEIYRQRIFNIDGNKLTLSEVLEVEELRSWSKYMVLKLVFMGISNSVGDIFQKKSELYASYEQKAFNEAMNQMRLDFNKDGKLDKADDKDFRTVNLQRR